MTVLKERSKPHAFSIVDDCRIFSLLEVKYNNCQTSLSSKSNQIDCNLFIIVRNKNETRFSWFFHYNFESIISNMFCFGRLHARGINPAASFNLISSPI